MRLGTLMPSADFNRVFPRRRAIQQHVDVLTKLEELRQRATLELGRRFSNYDINCVAVLIGRPERLV
jgi:hypothetical protein